MKVIRRITAATFAALLIGGLAMSPASAAVNFDDISYRINEELLHEEVNKLKLEGNFELNDLSHGIGAISPIGDSRALNNSRPKAGSEVRQR